MSERKRGMHAISNVFVRLQGLPVLRRIGGKKASVDLRWRGGSQTTQKRQVAEFPSGGFPQQR